MTHSLRPDRLQDVLDAYMAAAAHPDHATLGEWVRRYPEYQQELTAFTAIWGLTETLPPAPETDEISSGELHARGRAAVGRILAARAGLRVADAQLAYDTEPAREDTPADVKPATE